MMARLAPSQRWPELASPSSTSSCGRSVFGRGASLRLGPFRLRRPPRPRRAGGATTTTRALTKTKRWRLRPPESRRHRQCSRPSRACLRAELACAPSSLARPPFSRSSRSQARMRSSHRRGARRRSSSASRFRRRAAPLSPARLPSCRRSSPRPSARRRLFSSGRRTRFCGRTRPEVASWRCRSQRRRPPTSTGCRCRPLPTVLSTRWPLRLSRGWLRFAQGSRRPTMCPSWESPLERVLRRSCAHRSR